MRRLKGIIVSNKMHKTVVVRADRFLRHPKYLKFRRVSARFKAHDEKGEYRVGDVVMIEETRPLSKEKRWRIIELLKRLRTEDAASDDL